VIMFCLGPGWFSLSMLRPSLISTLTLHNGIKIRPIKIKFILSTVNSRSDYTLWTLYRSYSRGISANIELQVYRMTCLWPYLFFAVILRIVLLFKLQNKLGDKWRWQTDMKNHPPTYWLVTSFGFHINTRIWKMYRSAVDLCLCKSTILT
jgi:hypothetical protein